MQVANNPVQPQMMQVVQSMAAEAGFNVKLKSMEFASLLADQSAGNYQASQVGWSGRVDPDGNIHQFMTCKGGINDSKVCIPEVDKLLDEAIALHPRMGEFLSQGTRDQVTLSQAADQMLELLAHAT